MPRRLSGAPDDHRNRSEVRAREAVYYTDLVVDDLREGSCQKALRDLNRAAEKAGEALAEGQHGATAASAEAILKARKRVDMARLDFEAACLLARTKKGAKRHLMGGTFSGLLSGSR